jgi:uncharacterized protein YjbI with pentapeptide repeats
MGQRIILWRLAGLTIISLLSFFLLIWEATPSASSYSEVSHKGVKTPAQTTPTPDITVTALGKEKLDLEVKQLQLQEDHSIQAWIWSNIATIFSPTVVFLVAFIGGLRWWFRDRRLERQKQSEERFQSVIVNLGSKDAETRLGATVMLRTFLQPEYKQFHRQIFDLAVAHLRLQRTDQDSTRNPKPQEILIAVTRNLIPSGNKSDQPNTSGSLDSLSQALIALFRESFPQARDWMKKHGTQSGSFTIFDRLKLLLTRRKPRFDPQSLDAAEVRLSNAYLANADLEQAWMPRGFLREANLGEARLADANLMQVDFTNANLMNADLTRAKLASATLTGADLRGAIFLDTDVTQANFTQADLYDTDFTKVKLTQSGINFTETTLVKTNLMRANLTGATLIRARLVAANLANAVLFAANLTDATLTGAILTDAFLVEANFTNTDFGGGANLTKADLRGADFTKVKSIKGVNLTQATLVETKLMYQDLTGADLTGANLTGADLTGANLTNVTLTGANLTDANFENALLTGAHPETAAHLQNTKMHGVLDLGPGLDIECQNKGASF